MRILVPQLPLPQLTQWVGVLHHEGRAEQTRDPTPFPPASTMHRVGRSLLGKKVTTPHPPLWCTGAELPRGTLVMRQRAPQLCWRRLTYLEQSVEKIKPETIKQLEVFQKEPG